MNYEKPFFAVLGCLLVFAVKVHGWWGVVIVAAIVAGCFGLSQIERHLAKRRAEV